MVSVVCVLEKQKGPLITEELAQLWFGLCCFWSTVLHTSGTVSLGTHRVLDCAIVCSPACFAASPCCSLGTGEPAVCVGELLFLPLLPEGRVQPWT